MFVNGPSKIIFLYFDFFKCAAFAADSKINRPQRHWVRRIGWRQPASTRDISRTERTDLRDLLKLSRELRAWSDAGLAHVAIQNDL